MLVALMDVGAPRRCRVDDRYVGWKLSTVRIVVDRRSSLVDIDDGASIMRAIDAPLKISAWSSLVDVSSRRRNRCEERFRLSSKYNTLARQASRYQSDHDTSIDLRVFSLPSRQSK